jgi:hypothetical protein
MKKRKSARLWHWKKLQEGSGFWRLARHFCCARRLPSRLAASFSFLVITHLYAPARFAAIPLSFPGALILGLPPMAG